MKSGKVLLVGRPNVGKSTFLNNLIGTKVAITSPKPQTTRFPIKALYEEARGTVVFVDTPGLFGKAEDAMSKKINQKTLSLLNEQVDLVIYMVDHSRKRDFEEGKVLGLVRKIEKPKILVVNKIDKADPTYLPQYKVMEEEFKDVFLISALNKLHMKPLTDRIFELLPERKEADVSELSEKAYTPS
jgi:GTP-binding protein Era